MKMINAAKTTTFLTLVLMGLTATGHAKAADNVCTDATLNGTYTDRDTGTIVGLGPFAGVAIDRFDGKGRMTTTGMPNVNGNVSSSSTTGTYHVNSDCTGTYSVSGGGLSVEAYFVINKVTNELYILITNAGTVIQCIARKQFGGD